MIRWTRKRDYATLARIDIQASPLVGDRHNDLEVAIRSTMTQLGVSVKCDQPQGAVLNNRCDPHDPHGPRPAGASFSAKRFTTMPCAGRRK
jgi:hypothetical protein